MEGANSTQSGSQVRTLLVLESAVALVAAKACLALMGFGRSLRLTNMLVRALGRVNRATAIDRRVSQYSVAVATASAFLPGRFRCLEQSIVLYALLRIRGIAADFRLGIQPFGRKAHAWVEVDKVPLNEHGETIQKLAVFPPVSL
jgi:hypothetical protein